MKGAIIYIVYSHQIIITLYYTVQSGERTTLNYVHKMIILRKCKTRHKCSLSIQDVFRVCYCSEFLHKVNSNFLFSKDI